MDANKQLYEKLGKNEYDKVFPLTLLQNIIDKDTNNNLTVVLSRFNHLWIPYQGDKNTTRKAVPTIYRRNALTISYYNAENKVSITEKFIGSNMEAGVEVSWLLDTNWCKVLDEKYLEEVGAKIPIADGTIDYDMLSNSLKQLLFETGVSVVNYPDEEDLTIVSSTGCCNVQSIKFKDRPYLPSYKTGKGYKILRQNLLPVEGVFTGNSYKFDGILDESYCEVNGNINILPENYTINYSDLDGVHIGIFFDNIHKLFVLRVLFTDEYIPYYNYYSRWTIINANESQSYKSSEYYNIWNSCISDERPKLNTIFIYGNVNYQYIDEELKSLKNDIYLHYKNVLTQDMVSESNTRYIVRYNFDLNGETIIMPTGCEFVFEGGILEHGSLNLNGCRLNGMVGLESEYIINCAVSGWAVGQFEYRNNKMSYWNGTEWRSLGDAGDSDVYNKTQIDNMFSNYYTKSQTYNKTEIDNMFDDIADNYVTKNEFNEFKESIEQTITTSVNLDKIQEAINKGCNVTMSMPSTNNNKISLPLWTGTAAQYGTITPVVGITYNIID